MGQHADSAHSIDVSQHADSAHSIDVSQHADFAHSVRVNMLNLHIPAVIRSPDVGQRRRAFEYGIALL